MKKAFLASTLLLSLILTGAIVWAETEGHAPKRSHKGSHSSVNVSVPEKFIPPEPYKIRKLYRQIKKDCPGQNLHCYEPELFKIAAKHGTKAAVEVFVRLQKKSEVKQKTDGHHVVHHIGHEIARSFGPFPEALALCPKTYNFGCIHGFF